MHQSMARPEMQDLVCPVSSTREGKDNQSTVHVRFCELRLPFRGQGRGSAEEVREHTGQKKSPSAPWTTAWAVSDGFGQDFSGAAFTLITPPCLLHDGM